MLNADLRPLGVGEMLDRAVTLFVRRLGPIAATRAATYLPFLVVVFVVHWTLQPNAPYADSRAVDGIDRGIGLIALALTRTALARIVDPATWGQVSLADAYRRAWRRLVPQLITLAIEIGLLFVTAVGIAILAVLLMKAGSSLETSLPGHPDASRAILIGVLILASPFLVWLWFAYQVAAVRVAETAVDPRHAFSAALRLTLHKALRWRALIVGLVIAVAPAAFGYSIIALSGTIGDPTLSFAVDEILHILFLGIFEAFAVACAIVFDIDARVRREGLDLEQGLFGSFNREG